MSENSPNNIKNRKRIGIEHWKKIALLLVIYDLFVVNASYFLALLLRFDFRFSVIPSIYLSVWKNFAPIYSVICIIVFIALRLYQSIWAFASYTELTRIISASLITGFLHVVITLQFYGRQPISYYMIGFIVQFFLVSFARFSYRLILLLSGEFRKSRESSDTINVMIIGAGDAGQLLLRDIERQKSVDEKVRCIIDDNENKWNRFVDGVPVVGGRSEILYSAKKYHIDKIYLAMPSASASVKRDILNICKETDCELKQLPEMYKFANGELSLSKLQNVSVEDLLGREPVKSDMTEVFDYIYGKRVMVTGGGGSIGSELARQIASHKPALLLLLDIYENNVYDIQLELREKFPELNLVVLIGSVRDSRKIYKIFNEYKPQVVYHAAAHKHVPLMEDSPCEAIKNNALGTYKTAYAAMIHGCEKFVLISTDKAVNPTNIMGASKRLCEMIIQSFDSKIKAGKADEIPQLFTHHGRENADKDGTGTVFKNIKTEFVAVRFGNVLGSNGSVIPIFKKQIEKGNDLTVTHPDIIRYFMTIPEAVSLVMLAGTYAHGGEIFVLDMGSPVKIADLAKNLIRLSGLRLGVDINIQYTGLRPGEKLYEEKLMDEEGMKKTDNELIHIGSPIPFDIEEFLSKLNVLMKSAYANDENIREHVIDIVSTYHPTNN